MSSILSRSQRDRLVDQLKGYACLLVLFGHVIMGIRKAGISIPFFSYPLETFIWSFHVSLFIFLSGYVFHITGEYSRSSSRIQFVKHKLLNLGIPYVVFSIVYILINSMTSKTNTDFGPSDILFLWNRPIAQYWFLYSLFVLFLLWTVLSLFLKNWQITLVLTVLNYLAAATHIAIPFLNKGYPHALCFGLGTCLASLVVDKLPAKKRILIILIHVITVFALILSNHNTFLLVSDYQRVMGILASIAFISLLCEKSSACGSFLLFINRYSFPIYLLHTIFTAAIRIVLLRIGIHSYPIHVVIGTACGLIIPIIAGMITNRIPVFDFFFYPSKNIKRLSQKRASAH